MTIYGHCFFRAIALTILAIGLSGLAVAQADDDATTYRRYDERGEFQGTVRDTGDEQLRFYDEKGQLTGTARQEANGSWRTYDTKGEYTGTIKVDKH